MSGPDHADNIPGQPLLHSRYDPVSEAKRYLDSLELPDNVSFFILIEPGLGYLIPELKKRKTAAKIIALHADSRFRELNQNNDAPAWYPDSGDTVQGFLEKEIPDTPGSAIKIIEWRPSMRHYGNEYLALLGEAVKFIKRADASFRTGQGFGRRWIRNFFKNLSLVSNVLVFKPTDCAVVVTGSGPGLEEAIPVIRSLRHDVVVLASSSSALALAQGGICPDLLISTDGGFWAHKHLHSCLQSQPEIAGVAVNLCAAIPSQFSGVPFLVLGDGSLWQTIVLNALEIPSALIPQRGTVAACALELALELSRGPVYLAGMDLSLKDIRTHARPYSFDQLLFDRASRLTPYYSQCYTRAYSVANGGSLTVYAEWFKERLKSWPKRIFSMDKQSAIFTPIPDTFAAGQSTFKHSSGQPSTARAIFQTMPVKGNSPMDWGPINWGPMDWRPINSRRDFCRRAVSALCLALENPQFSETLTHELGDLFFPGEKQQDKAELLLELNRIEARYGSLRHE